MATINPNQDYDIIHTLTFAEASGTCPIRLYRGSSSAYTGTVYYRARTSGDWTTLSVSGTATTFPVTSTTMQVAHNWNKSGNNYMTPSFRDATNITSIAISQKSSLTGAMGNYFMVYYARGCSSLTELLLPAVGWFEDNNVNWSVPSGRLGVLEGHVLNSDDLNGWRALTAEGKTLYTNYIRDPNLVYCEEATEYCEHNADTLRKVLAGQSFSGDTKRVVRADQVYSADALRQAIKEYEFIADTLRKIAPPHIRLKVTLSIQERDVGLDMQERKPSLSIQEREVKLEVE